MGKKSLDFGDLDLIFKVTPALWMSNFDQKKKYKKNLSAFYLLNQMIENQMIDSGQTICIVSLG